MPLTAPCQTSVSPRAVRPRRVRADPAGREQVRGRLIGDRHVRVIRQQSGEFDTQLVIIESPYRTIAGPLLHYLDEIERQRPTTTPTVVLPEFAARQWRDQLLHHQTALRLKASLLFRPGTVVVSVPYHLGRGRLATR